MYGNLRQTDFLPVGEGTESEITERGVLSESNDGDEEFIEFVGAGSDPYFLVEDIEIVINPDSEE